LKSVAIIPTLNERADSLVKRSNGIDPSIVTFSDVLDELFLRIYPNENEIFQMYDGTTFSVNKMEDMVKLVISNVNNQMKYHIKIYSKAKPRKITLNNKSLKYSIVKNANFLSDKNVYFYDFNKNFVGLSSIVNKDTILMLEY
jgi:hypothetical protein